MNIADVETVEWDGIGVVSTTLGIANLDRFVGSYLLEPASCACITSEGHIQTPPPPRPHDLLTSHHIPNLAHPGMTFARPMFRQHRTGPTSFICTANIRTTRVIYTYPRTHTHAYAAGRHIRGAGPTRPTPPVAGTQTRKLTYLPIYY